MKKAGSILLVAVGSIFLAISLLMTLGALLGPELGASILPGLIVGWVITCIPLFFGIKGLVTRRPKEGAVAAKQPQDATMAVLGQRVATSETEQKAEKERLQQLVLEDKTKRKEQKQEEKARQEDQYRQGKAALAIQKEIQAMTVSCEHTAGLPLAQGSACTVVFGDSQVSISGGGTSFDLANEKISDVTVKTSTDIQKSYVSSIGGAVGGAMMFGVLGAMVGGRAKQKSSKIIEYYLIITYDKAGEIAFLSFLIPEVNSIRTENIVKKFSATHIGVAKRVEL